MSKIIHGLSMGPIIGVIRAEWELRYRYAVRPTRVTLEGVQLELDERWATPAVRAALYRRWYEVPERQILEGTLRPEDRYLEVGAGIGFVMTCACRIVGAENVTAYEANPELALAAAATARRNGFEPTIVNAVLGERDGKTNFYVHDDFWVSSLTPSHGAEAIRVAVRAFRSELDRLKPTYLMVDIEGGEVALLGGDPLPDYVRAVCVEVHPATVGVDATQSLLVKLIGEGLHLDLAKSWNNVAFLRR
jgi:FkbM family methyltransferase